MYREPSDKSRQIADPEEDTKIGNLYFANRAQAVASWQGGGQGRQLPSPFWAVRKLYKKISCCQQIFVRKMPNFGLKIAMFGHLRAKIKILSTHNLFCRRFAAVCEKIASSSPHTFYRSMHSNGAVF